MKIIFIICFLSIPFFGKTDELKKTFDWHQSFDGPEKYFGKEVLHVYLGKGKEKEIADISKYKNRLESFNFYVDQNGDFFIGYEKRVESSNHLDKHKTYIISKFYKSGQNAFEKEAEKDDFPKNDKSVFDEVEIKVITKQSTETGSSLMVKYVKTGKPIVILTEPMYGSGYLVTSPFGKMVNRNFFIISQLPGRVYPDDGGSEFLIRKYSLDGQLLTAFYTKEDEYKCLSNPGFRDLYQVDKSGNVYQLHTDPDGFQVIKWSK